MNTLHLVFPSAKAYEAPESEVIRVSSESGFLVATRETVVIGDGPQWDEED